jgi:hypothetical protein
LHYYKAQAFPPRNATDLASFDHSISTSFIQRPCNSNPIRDPYHGSFSKHINSHIKLHRLTPSS